MSEPRISIIIVSFNTKDALKECLNRLRKVEVPIEVFVVDNNSKDGTCDMLRNDFGEWPALKVIYNKNNVGFTRASNQPIPLCSGEYVLFLNPDTIVKPGTLEELAAFLDVHPDVGIVGPKLVYNDGTLQISCGRSWELSHIILWHLLPVRISQSIFRRSCARWARYEQKNVRWILGACLMTRRELLLEIGGFDENFFLSADDAADLCLRFIKKGYRVIYYPKAEVVHLGGVSYKHIRAFALLNVYRGHIYFVKKYYGVVHASMLKVMLSLLSIVKGLSALIMGAFNAQYRLLGKVHLETALKTLIMSIPNQESNHRG